MKLHFEDDLDYQKAAIDSAVDLFRGQEISRSEFTVAFQPEVGPTVSLGMEESALGIGNRLLLNEGALADNLQEVQLRNGLQTSETMTERNFTIEMETGTGKTYVYLRTIMELNSNYGFTKFVIVVPSIAIKEGVYKTLQITQEHFEGLYPKAKGYEYFLYDSSKLGQVRNFATSSNIQIMVTTVGAINKKDVNNLYKENENTGGEKPIDLVCAANPIIIVDEPQSVDGGLKGAGKEALGRMNPLCTLRYSATHEDKHHMIYRLDAVDAYERGLVKQIEIASLQIDSGHNLPYIRLESTQNRKGSITAKVEVDIQRSRNIKRELLTVEDGDNLGQRTGRSIYENIRIGTITCGADNESIEVSGNNFDQKLRPGDTVGGEDSEQIKRLMIRRTIKEHLDKELTFLENDKEIKVLSLFFIDSVEFYRQYDEDGNRVKGKYAVMFEEEYRKLAEASDYKRLFKGIDLDTHAAEVHEGYFSIDRKGRSVETEENNQTNRDNAERAYNLIMRDKEKLLSFDTKLKFIFSHSALKEGWDNPNVFQICTLRDMGTERERRQTLGRGLRLCVDQNGDRLRARDVNTLTVIATESYERFAENLQREIEEDTGIRFGVVEPHQFATILVVQSSMLGVDKSQTIWDSLLDQGFIDAGGKVQDSLLAALDDDTFRLSEDVYNTLEEEHGKEAADATATNVRVILRRLSGKLDIKNANERITIKTKGRNLNNPDFRALWDRIKHKTTYRVKFNNPRLLKDCASAIRDVPPLTRTRARFVKADMSIDRSGARAMETNASGYTNISEGQVELPDIITDLQDRTQLTRRSIVQILTESGRLQDFLPNPQQFIEYCAEAINRTKRLAIVDGIQYTRIGDDSYYAQELFKQEELTSYIKNAMLVKKSVHTHVIYDSGSIEKTFAEDMESNEQVKVYAKLPAWFKIPTPLGTYNPDWAVVVENEGKEKLYFVVETKGSEWWDDLRQKEAAKIKCGEKHFEAVAEGMGVGENPACYIKTTGVDKMLDYVDEDTEKHLET